MRVSSEDLSEMLLYCYKNLGIIQTDFAKEGCRQASCGPSMWGSTRLGRFWQKVTRKGTSRTQVYEVRIEVSPYTVLGSVQVSPVQDLRVLVLYEYASSPFTLHPSPFSLWLVQRRCGRRKRINGLAGVTRWHLGLGF